jgi:hypothetical protein
LSANDSIANIYDMLRELYLLLREEELPPMDGDQVEREAETEEVGA